MTRALVLVVVISGLILSSLATRNADLAWMSLPFLVYLGIGVWQSPSPGRIRLHAGRSLDATRARGISSVQVALKISNAGIGIDRLSCQELPPAAARPIDRPLRETLALEPGEQARWSYRFQAVRGRFAWTSVKATVSDSLGLIESALELPANGEIQVQPELPRYRPLPLRTQETVRAPGSILARLGGPGTDFWGVREYQIGDPLRRLDWRRSARHPGRLFSKEFEQEELASIGIVLDARPQSDVRIGDDHLFEHSVQATTALAEVFLRQGNRVSLLTFGNPMISLYPGYGKIQLNRILGALSHGIAEEQSPIGSLELLPLHIFPNRSLIIILSPLVGSDSISWTSSDWYLFPRLRALHYEVLLISPDPFDFAAGILPQDPAGQRAIRLARLERYLQLRRVAQLWVPVIDWKVGQSLQPLVRNALRRGAGRRER